jgi:hypothetical protein
MSQSVCSPNSRKKPKGKALSVGEKLLNRILSGVRVQVEHTLAGVKRCRIVKDVLRHTKEGISDLVMEIACALHNLRLMHLMHHRSSSTTGLWQSQLSPYPR